MDENACMQVTVVIPAYNYATYLPMAVESVLAQTFSDFILLIIDDGSIDETAAVARSYENTDARVRYRYQENAGLSAARNTGIREAKTAFVAFLDADDEWAPTFLERSLQVIEQLPEEFALVGCRNLLIDRRGERIPKRSAFLKKEPREITRSEIIMKSRFPADSVLVRRAVFERCGMFDETLRSTEDRDMWIRIAAHYRLYFFPEPLVQVRRHERNMSSYGERMRENMHKVLHKARLQERQGLINVLFWLRVASYCHCQTAWMFHEEGRRGRAISDIAFSFILWPFFFCSGDLDEPRLFRMRALGRFLLRPVKERTLP